MFSRIELPTVISSSALCHVGVCPTQPDTVSHQVLKDNTSIWGGGGRMEGDGQVALGQSSLKPPVTNKNPKRVRSGETKKMAPQQPEII